MSADRLDPRVAVARRAARDAAARRPVPYEPPALELLGTLTELTLGGVDGAISDGHGTSGDTGSL